MLGVLSLLRKALAAALMCGALVAAAAAQARADDGSGVTLIWRVGLREASAPCLGACPSSFAAPGATGLCPVHDFSTLGQCAPERKLEDQRADEAATELPDWAGEVVPASAFLAEAASDTVTVAAEPVSAPSNDEGDDGDGPNHGHGPGHGHDEDDQAPGSGSDPTSLVDLGSLDDSGGEDDFDSSGDGLFHACLCLDGLGGVERALPDAIEPSAGYSRLVDGRCDRPPRV